MSKPIMNPCLEIGRRVAIEALNHPAVKTREDLIALACGMINLLSAHAPTEDDGQVRLVPDADRVATCRFLRNLSQITGAEAAEFASGLFRDALAGPALDLAIMGRKVVSINRPAALAERQSAANDVAANDRMGDTNAPAV